MLSLTHAIALVVRDNRFAPARVHNWGSGFFGSCSGPRCVGGEGFRVNSARTLMGAYQRAGRSKDSAGGTGDGGGFFATAAANSGRARQLASRCTSEATFWEGAATVGRLTGRKPISS